MNKRMKAKLRRDTGGGCSICRQKPVVNVEGTYWLCGECVNEKLLEHDKLLEAAISAQEFLLASGRRMPTLDAAIGKR